MLTVAQERIMRDEAKRTADKYISRDGYPVSKPLNAKAGTALEIKQLADVYVPRPKPPVMFACRASGKANSVSKRCRVNGRQCRCPVDDPDIPF